MAQNQKLFMHICGVLSMMLIFLSLTACGHIHKWQDATCTAYTNFMYDDKVTKAFAPVGDPKLVNYTFIVR